MSAGFFSFSNTYIPSSNSNKSISTDLIIQYARNIKDFRLLQYSNITPVSKPIGYYLRISNAAAWRINPTNGNGFKWTPGQTSPSGQWNQQGFEMKQWSTEQFRVPTQIPLQAIDVASFKLEPTMFSMLCQQAMTRRTLSMATVATTASNYPTAHVATANALAGGYLDAGTNANPYLQNAVQSAVQTISKSTGGMVGDTAQCAVICNPASAALLSRSEETRGYLSNQIGAIRFLRGEEPTNSRNWNLPDKIYGADLIIENAIYNDGPLSAADDTSNNNYCWPDDFVLVVAKPTKIEWPEGATGNPATLTTFEYEAMNAETQLLPWDRLLNMAITEQYQCQVAAPLTGFLITDCFA